MKFKLPRRFIQDRLDRDLPCGTVTIKGNIATVECSPEVLDDIEHDAEYQGWHTTQDRASIQSAQRAFKQLRSYKAARLVWQQ